MKKHLLRFSLAGFTLFFLIGGLLVFHRSSTAAKKLDVIENFSSPDKNIATKPTSPVLSEEKKETDAPPVVETAKINTDPPEIKPAATYPAEILNLANWKQTLPIGKSKSPAEIKQPMLTTYAMNSCFNVDSQGDGVVFRAPVNGVTTSGSGYPRSELREMTNGGKALASWSTTSGTNTMTIDEAITAVPKDKKHVVAGQIHNANDDVIVIRLEYPKLFVDINGQGGPTLDANYTLGKRFTVKFVAENGQIKVYYNGGTSPAYTMNKKISGCYFKAGAYTQSNCTKEKDCSSDNYGEVVIYNLTVSH